MTKPLLHQPLPSISYNTLSFFYNIAGENIVAGGTLRILRKKYPQEESGLPEDKLPSLQHTNCTGSLQDENILRAMASLRTHDWNGRHMFLSLVWWKTLEVQDLVYAQPIMTVQHTETSIFLFVKGKYLPSFKE